MHISMLEQAFQSYPFKLQSAQRLFLQQVDNQWYNQQQSQSIKVLSHVLVNQKSYFSLVYYLINKQVNSKTQTSILYITDTAQRKELLLQLAQFMYKMFFEHIRENQLGGFGSRYIQKLNNNQIVFMTFKEFIKNDIQGEHQYDGMLIQTSHFVRMVRDGFYDYITDTYLRRAYIQALRFQQSYRQFDKITANQISTANFHLSKKKSSQQPELISLHSRQSSLQKKQSIITFKNLNNEHNNFGFRNHNVQNSKKIRRTFEIKKQKLEQGKTIKNSTEKPLFQQNQLVLISAMIYIIGFFYSQISIKKNIKFDKFIEDFQNKTLLNVSFLQNIVKYYEQIFNKCPTKVYEKIQQTYLYSLCQFINRIILYRKIFPHDHDELFQIRFQKSSHQRREGYIEQSSSTISIHCKQNNKICQKILKYKALNTIIIQNFACHSDYWHYVFRKSNILINPTTEQQKYSKIYGLHISKTPSNQYINFAEKLRDEIETIKYKVCGVLLHDLSKFIPDGIIVYFYSLEGLQTFRREMNKDEENILKKINNNKKIFIQSVFEQQNLLNFQKFKKCCQIGRGAIFFLVANSKAAQHLKFYDHLSRCVVFFGLPRRENQIRKQIQIKHELQQDQQKQLIYIKHFNMERISIFNQCLNNCINNMDDYKCVVFVGKQISNDLQDWYRSFIRSWGEATRDSLTHLRQHFQKMGKMSIW